MYTRLCVVQEKYILEKEKYYVCDIEKMLPKQSYRMKNAKARYFLPMPTACVVVGGRSMPSLFFLSL